MYATLHGEVPLRYAVTDPDAPAAGRLPVLLLHGFGSDYAMNWEHTGWPATLVAEGVTAIGLDLRGHGASGKPQDPRAYLPGAFVDDAERLLDALGIARVDVLGYSMGSRLAWELALTRPARVRRAVLGGFGPVNAFAGADLDRLDTDGSPFGAVYRASAALPGNDPVALAACARGQAAHAFAAEPAPTAPLLLAAGESDDIASGMERLAASCGAAGALRVARRDHRTAVSASEFKRAVLDFLAR